MPNPKTTNLGLDLIDRTSPGTTYLNLQTNVDDNWQAIDEKLGAQIAVSPSATQLDFTYGIQALTMPRTAQWYMKGLSGRTLVNLLGRDGNCEDISKWLTAGATPTLDPVNKVYGSNGIKITSTGVNSGLGIYKASLPVIDPTKYHIAVADMKNGNATRCFLLFSGQTSDYVADTTKFNVVWKAVTPAQLAASTNISLIMDVTVTGQYAYVDGARIYQLADEAEYNAIATMNAEEIAVKYPYVDDMKSIMNPWAICYGQSEVVPYTKDQMIVIPSQFASNVDGTVADQLYRVGAEYWVDRHFKTVEITGDFASNWTLNADFVGYKAVSCTGVLKDKNINIVPSGVKYDGKILGFNTSTAADQIGSTGWADTTNWVLTLSIADTDSGWGEGYNPTAAEIQAYFYGWRMRTDASTAPYNGSGTKGWGTILSGGQDLFTTVLPVSSSPFPYTPYKLQYQLATPVQEKIIPEGEITLIEGLNQVETGVGMIVRERVTPTMDSDGNTRLNNNFSGSSVSFTKYRVNKFIALYKGIPIDSGWQKYGTAVVGNNGLESYAKPTRDFDPSAAYTVTYLALDQYSLSCSFQTIQGEYDSNLKTGVDRLARNQAEIATRVSVLESQKAGKVQPQWIQATLLSGWTGTIEYMKDSLGFVHFRGEASGGATADNTGVLRVPKGYIPSKIMSYPITYGNTGLIGMSNGGVLFLSGGFSGILRPSVMSYLAEQ